MKAKYIIDAIAAMRDVERLGFTMEPKEFATIVVKCAFARASLEIVLGDEAEVKIEKETT